MAYSLNLLTTRPQCDLVLAAANELLARLTFRDVVTDRSAELAGKAAADLVAELAGLTALVNALTPVVPTLPAGHERTKQENDLRQSNDRREELLARQVQNGPNKLVERELLQALIVVQVPVVEDLIAQVVARRATLPA